MANKRHVVPGKKMDPYLVSGQSWELAYIAKKFSTTVDKVKAAKKLVGRSRRAIYLHLKTK